ncbi:MAG TPA: hypothetical protein K8V00_10915 [Ligilactobacillus acidipiscis]|uniref:Uncharacterized protein n=1 Tax=Ligilactobacillus acidipiscis TaxID=89059 RepID=A0A921FA14_9LACO|nr:hypothetical protein [Ligilactobacillus acidipiscis]
MTHDLDSEIMGYKLLVDFPDFALYADEHDNLVQRYSMDLVAKYDLEDKKYKFSPEMMAYLKNYIVQYKEAESEKKQIIKRYIEQQFLKQ